MRKLTRKEAEEYIKCAQSAVYTLQNYAYLKHIKRGKMKWKPYPWQLNLVELYESGANVIILKSRQVGASWITAFFVAWAIHFMPDIEVLLLSQTEKKAIKLLAKVRFIAVNFPPFLRREFNSDSKTRLSVIHKRDGGDVVSESSVDSLTTTSGSGRGDTAAIIFADELAHLPNDEETWTAIRPATSRGGQLICASSPAGPENVFGRLWFTAEMGDSRTFIPVRVHYTDCGFDEKWLAEVSDGMTEEQVLQEFELAFVGAGSPAFDPEHLKNCYIPMSEIMSNPELENIKVLVEKSRVFYTGVDSAEIKILRGVKRKDFNAIASLNEYGIQVATETNQMPLDEWAGKTVDIGDERVEIPGYVSQWHASHPGTMYIEENSSGLTVANRHILPEDHVSSVVVKRTTSKSKPREVNQFKLAVAGQQVIITDQKTYYQLMLFQDLGNGKYSAPAGSHDDLVIAMIKAWDALLRSGGFDFIMPAIDRLGYIPLIAGDSVDQHAMPVFDAPMAGLSSAFEDYEPLRDPIVVGATEWAEFLPNEEKLANMGF